MKPSLARSKGQDPLMIIVVIALALGVILILIPVVERWERQQKAQRRDRMKRRFDVCEWDSEETDRET